MSVKVKTEAAASVYTPRAVTMQRIIDAALELLLDSPPDQVTNRDVTDRAGVHHRYIPDWFGGKLGLIAAVYPKAVDAAVGALVFPRSMVDLTPEMLRLLRIITWLGINGPDQLNEIKGLPMKSAIEAMLVERFAVDGETARLLAQRTLALVIGLFVAGQLVGLAPEDLQRQLALEVRIALLLAEHGSGDLGDGAPFA